MFEFNIVNITYIEYVIMVLATAQLLKNEEGSLNEKALTSMGFIIGFIVCMSITLDKMSYILCGLLFPTGLFVYSIYYLFFHCQRHIDFHSYLLQVLCLGITIWIPYLLSITIRWFEG